MAVQGWPAKLDRTSSATACPPKHGVAGCLSLPRQTVSGTVYLEYAVAGPPDVA